MARNQPCRACKKRRKGCIWEQNSNACLLCTKFKVECIPANDSSDNGDILPREYNLKTLEYWHYQITQLENELQQTERDLVFYRDKQQELESLEWKLSIENGQLKLHTAIRSFEELIIFSQASLRYLSPFGSVIKVTPFRFENRALATIMHTACQGITQQSLKGRLLYASPEAIPYTIPQIQTLVDELIRLHLRYNNRRMPLLHAPTFLQHYNSLTDPLSCPLTLAVCAYTICTHRSLLETYSGLELRQLGEFFCCRSKELLMDVFDDPNRKLKTVFTITFLNHFVTSVMLQPLEGRRLITIAYLLCQDLEPGFSKLKEPTVMSVLFQRHYFHIQRSIGHVNHTIDGTSNPCPFPPKRTFEKLPDEDEVTCTYIDVFNQILQFLQKPCIKSVIALTENPVTDISLDTIFQSDRAIREWYNELPLHLRICDDPYAEDADIAVTKNPKPLSTDESVEKNMGIIRMLSEKAISQVLRSCDLLLSTVLHIIKGFKEDMPPLTFELMSRAIHGLVTVATCSSIKIPASLQRKFLNVLAPFKIQYHLITKFHLRYRLSRRT
ncbi:hypothetical protein BJV82DRAFT_716058 [Fennellomyces sp. T-0311]|nr:hypothetical protein BJV82DRAFT_716058 [Fennellomyces sp. T-0311]